MEHKQLVREMIQIEKYMEASDLSQGTTSNEDFINRLKSNPNLRASVHT